MYDFDSSTHKKVLLQHHVLSKSQLIALSSIDLFQNSPRGMMTKCFMQISNTLSGKLFNDGKASLPMNITFHYNFSHSKVLT